MLVLTRKLHTISISLLEDLSLILPQPKVEKSLMEFWAELPSFVSTSQLQQNPRCMKRKLQRSNQTLVFYALMQELIACSDGQGMYLEA
jgi:hypothetical protein